MASNMNITYRQGIRNKGFQTTVPTTGASQTLSLSGLAKAFEGIKFSATTAAAPSVAIDAVAAGNLDHQQRRCDRFGGSFRPGRFCGRRWHYKWVPSLYSVPSRVDRSRHDFASRYQFIGRIADPQHRGVLQERNLIYFGTN
jgi:hypothetical protein